MKNKNFFVKFDIILLVLFLVLSIILFRSFYKAGFDKTFEENTVEVESVE